MGLYTDLWKGKSFQAGQSIDLITFKHKAEIDHFNQYIDKKFKDNKNKLFLHLRRLLGVNKWKMAFLKPKNWGLQ
ncbi:MAG: hypothetical protein IPL95_19895 [Saprospiraceae bacterium]|nr:hypothetical protein [Saprospiraceae bacterium]